jgi:hypothetical protein
LLRDSEVSFSSFGRQKGTTQGTSFSLYIEILKKWVPKKDGYLTLCTQIRPQVALESSQEAKRRRRKRRRRRREKLR